MKTRFRRLFAAFLLVNMLQSIFLPPALHALTSGPTTPETTSFEPVDTTDMVNLTTGDFTYNVPLIEVPSPEGGYPVALSYHAGIKPLEDASWVGLGWTLNPGAINRTVNGYPDDHNGTARYVTDSWQGGSTKTYSVGVGIGIKQMGGGVGVELSLSNDTYRGFSGDVALTASVGYKLTENIGIGVSASAGTNGFTAGATIGFTTGAGIRLAGGVSTNFSKISGGLSASQSVSTYQSKSGTFYNSSSLWSTGVSLSSRGLKPNMSVAGFQSNTNNANYGKISTSSFGFSLPIPIGPVTLTLGYNYVRYWMLESDNVNVYGSLYAREAASSFSNGLPGGGPSDKSFDSFAMLDTSLSTVVHNNPEWLLGGSLPAYDQYQVMGQGVSGSMKPLITENISLFREKVPDNSGNPSLATNYAVTTTHSTNKIRFRFDNDFASYMTKNPGSLTFANNFNFPYSASLSSHSSTIPSEGFAGSKNIEWYKNSEIKPDVNNLRLAQSQGFVNTEDMPDSERNKIGGSTYPALNDQIGGFMITNESGTTYHYGLPVYAYGEYTSNVLPDPVNGTSSNSQTNKAPYAYTWLLTAITGPDYVDDGDGIADEGDYGYWVKFRYGKWVDDYNWRTPETGYMHDLKSKVQSYSYGTKQLYYLDAIVTRTHTALFVKDIRKDGKSVSYPDEDSGFGPYEVDDVTYESTGRVNYFWSKSTLKLDEIYLVKNDILSTYNLTVDQIRALSSSISQSVLFSNQSASAPAHYGGKVIDKNDLLQGNAVQIAPNAVKSIGFTTDYSLCDKTINSFDNAAYYTSSLAASVRTLSGKLCLKRLVFRGRNSNISLPPLEFTYDNTDAMTPFTVTGGSESNRRITIANTSYSNGDLIYMETNATTYEYAMIYDKEIPTNNYKLMKVGGTTTILSGTPNVKKTCNPPFSNYKYDYWGYYKPDFMTNSHASNLAWERQPSSNSSKCTSVWSLRKIKTSLGSDVSVTYEPRDYASVEMLDFESLNIKSIVAEPDYGHGNRKVKIMFKEGFDLSMIFKAGQSLTGVIGYTISSANCGGLCSSANETIQINTVATDYIIVTLNSATYNGLVASCQGYPPNLVTVYASYSQSGLVKMPQPFTIGDGIRVKAINLIGSDGIERVTNYSYQNGKTSYLPVSLNQDPISFCNAPAELEQYNLALRTLMVKSREIPGPGVIYKNVSVEEKLGGVSQGRRDYTFETFDKSMVTIDYSVAPVPESAITLNTGETMTVSYRNVQINNRTSRVGNLLKLQEYNQLGQLVRTVDNTYATSNTHNSNFKNQGIVQEAYNEVRPKEKSTNGSDQNYNFRKSVVTSRKTFPSFLISSSVREANGNNSTSYNRAFDLFSGEPTVIENINPYGLIIRSVSVPAYRASSLYRNGDITSDIGMGLKINSMRNKNMLTQNAGSYLFRVSNWYNPATTTNPELENVTAVLDASVTTWNRDWAYRDYNSVSDKYPLSATTDNTNRVWRKHKQWLLKKDLNPDGSLAVTPSTWLAKTGGSALISFDPLASNEAANIANGWQKASEVTYYDRFSKPLEEVDINGNYAAAKMGYGTGNGPGNRNSLIIASASPSKYVEFAFSGAEDFYSPETNVNYFGGEVLAPGAAFVSNTKAHTGDRSIKLNSTNVYGFGYRADVGTGPDQIGRKKYEAMVWVDSLTAQAGRKYLYCNVYNSSNQSISWTAATINDANAVRVGSWFRLRLPIDLTNLTTATRIEIGTWTDGQTTDVYLDDLRFKPADAVMTSYVYDTKTDQVRFILDNDHLYTEYRYDSAGRLIAVLKETPDNPTGKRAVSQHIYHYMRDKQ